MIRVAKNGTVACSSYEIQHVQKAINGIRFDRSKE